MGVIHQAENPGAPVSKGLTEANPDAGRFLALSGVGGDAVVGKPSLLLAKPAGLERVVGEQKEGEEGDDNGEGALDDEEPGRLELVLGSAAKGTDRGIPTPTSKAMDAIETSEDTGRDKTSETGSNHVASVEDSHS